MKQEGIQQEISEEELEIKRQLIQKEVDELLEMYRLERIERKKDLKLKIFHPIKWRRKHKDDPIWMKRNDTNLVKLSFVTRR